MASSYTVERLQSAVGRLQDELYLLREMVLKMREELEDLRDVVQDYIRDQEQDQEQDQEHNSKQSQPVPPVPPSYMPRIIEQSNSANEYVDGFADDYDEEF